MLLKLSYSKFLIKILFSNLKCFVEIFKSFPDFLNCVDFIRAMALRKRRTKLFYSMLFLRRTMSNLIRLLYLSIKNIFWNFLKIFQGFRHDLKFTCY